MQELNPWVSLAVADDAETLQPLVEAFASWLDGVSELSYDSVREVLAGASSGAHAAELISAVNDLLLSGDESCLDRLDEYIRGVTDLMPLDEADLEPRYLLDDIDRLFGADATGQASVGYYADCGEVVKAHSSPGAQLLVPFVCALFRPVDPWTPWRTTEGLLLEAMDRLAPASMPDLAATARNSGRFISDAYLQLKIINSTAFLSFASGTTGPLYAATAQVLPHFALAACGIETDPNAPAANLLPKRLLDFFCRWNETGYIPYLDQAEILAKLRQYRRSRRSLVQGLDPTLHDAIVQTLQERKVVMQVRDLCQALGIERIPLAADRLPPGRIVAYAPSRRYLDPEITFYGLREWVEDDRHRRGRIAKDRIVTPLKIKDVEITPAMAFEAIASDPTFAKYGVVLLCRVAKRLASRLPQSPTELYYLRILERKMVTYSKRSLLPIGKGLFIRRRGRRFAQMYPTARERRRAFAEILTKTANLTKEALQSLDPADAEVLALLLE